MHIVFTVGIVHVCIYACTVMHVAYKYPNVLCQQVQCIRLEGNVRVVCLLRAVVQVKCCKNSLQNATRNRFPHRTLCLAQHIAYWIIIKLRGKHLPISLVSIIVLIDSFYFVHSHYISTPSTCRLHSNFMRSFYLFCSLVFEATSLIIPVYRPIEYLQFLRATAVPAGTAESAY